MSMEIQPMKRRKQRIKSYMIEDPNSIIKKNKFLMLSIAIQILMEHCKSVLPFSAASNM